MSLSTTKAHELLIATPDWRLAARTPTVIDIDEFRGTQSDPSWLAFCQKADAYVSAIGTNPIKETTG